MIVREGIVDVAVVAGPSTEYWPSAGTRALSLFCAEHGLTVGVYGGEGMRVLGVIPGAGTGALCMIEDAQGRLHRVRARAVIKFRPLDVFPEPFPGWASEAALPIMSVERLLGAGRPVVWTPAVAILGSGNRALRLGSRLLETRTGGERPEVYIVEPRGYWSEKPYAGWEVERRRFVMRGGRFLAGAHPLSLNRSENGYELRLQDAVGKRLIEISRLVYAGPWGGVLSGIREFPRGSLLFELEQTSMSERSGDVEGWAMEEDRARLLAAKIVKALVPDLGERKEKVDGALRRARSRLRNFSFHRESPFEPVFEGKWLSPSSQRELKAFSGVPTQDFLKRKVASIECVEDIVCNLCEKACPESAIHFPREGRRKGQVLVEADCTGCGACVAVCPSDAAVMLFEKPAGGSVTLPWRGAEKWVVGEKAILVSRHGEELGVTRIEAVEEMGEGVSLVQVAVPSHLIWDARAVKKRTGKGVESDDPDYRRAVEREKASGGLELFLNGEKRWVQPEATLLEAFRQIGHWRPRDMLACPDGSCGRCTVHVDGIRRLACETRVRAGMNVRSEVKPAEGKGPGTVLCPCEGVTVEQVEEAIEASKLSTPSAVAEATRVGRGRCHGQLCGEPFRKCLEQQKMEGARDWIDWRFPWQDWKIGAAEREK